MPPHPTDRPSVRPALRGKARPMRDMEFRRAWAARHPWCQFCGVSEARAPWPGLSTHHIIRPGRSDEATNLFRSCDRCHSVCHGARVRVGGALLARLTLGMQLRAKRIADPVEYNAGRLEALYRKCLPDEEELPGWLLEIREGRLAT